MGDEVAQPGCRTKSAKRRPRDRTQHTGCPAEIGANAVHQPTRQDTDDLVRIDPAMATNEKKTGQESEPTPTARHAVDPSAIRWLYDTYEQKPTRRLPPLASKKRKSGFTRVRIESPGRLFS